ncbi:SDR family oxidoreductase [Streptomyces katrae]|uniref:SDR family oxidoreductase n=1 Tax=Streptomyces katrae TaxID=68223 RepID=A0ABT7GP24_9ACTN|nr:SDR family oxidoreductase [Streptomyces katrae]MDK9495339.1 SDR family oxidoreductase [Streptomyces katrae]
MILVTGATGTVGREVLRRLSPDLRVRAMARQPDRLAQESGTAETVRGDYDDPESLALALDGVDSVFLVTSRVGRDDDARFLRIARSAGVRHVVKLSAAAVEDGDADDLITRWQRENEDLLRGSGMEWTLLRPRSFMSNALSWASSIRSDGVVRALYGESANSCVDPRDIAEAAVRTLTAPGHAGRAYALTGPRALTAAEQTAQLAELLGRPLRFEELDPAQARAQWSARYPEPLVEALLSSAERQRRGAKAGVGGSVEELTGRPAGSFRAWAGDHLAAFARP